MNEDTPKLERKDYEIPCQLHPVTEFDMSEGIPPEQLANIPVGSFIRDEVLLEAVEFDFSQEGNSKATPGEEGNLGNGQNSRQKGCQQSFLDDSAGKGS